MGIEPDRCEETLARPSLKMECQPSGSPGGALLGPQAHGFVWVLSSRCFSVFVGSGGIVGKI